MTLDHAWVANHNASGSQTGVPDSALKQKRTLFIPTSLCFPPRPGVRNPLTVPWNSIDCLTGPRRHALWLMASDEKLTSLGDVPVQGQYVAELTDNDVLLGRGQPILNYQGNIRFRKLIQRHKEEYTSTGKHSAKHEIASRILNTIEANGGRFLRKIEDQQERDDLQIPDTVMHAWRVVDDAVKMQKVKQALREQQTDPAAPPKSKGKKKREHGSESKDEQAKRQRSPADGTSGFHPASVPSSMAQHQASLLVQPLSTTEPFSLLRMSQAPDTLSEGNAAIDRNGLLAHMKDQPLNPQMLFLLQQQRRQQAMASLAAWQRQQLHLQSSAVAPPGAHQSMMFNPMRMMPAAPSNFIPQYQQTPSERPSLQDAVQHYLTSQQQQRYQPQALLSPLEPAPLQVDEPDNGGFDGIDGLFKNEESSVSSSEKPSEGPPKESGV